MSGPQNTRACPWCNTRFKATRSNTAQKYCQDSCRWAASQYRRLASSSNRDSGLDLRLGWIAEGRGAWAGLGAYYAALKHDPCAYCGGPAGTIDHIVPTSVLGENHFSNLTGSCQSCNSSKCQRPLLFHLLLCKIERVAKPLAVEWEAVAAASADKFDRRIPGLRKVRVRDNRRNRR